MKRIMKIFIALAIVCCFLNELGVKANNLKRSKRYLSALENESDKNDNKLLKILIANAISNKDNREETELNKILVSAFFFN
jgi:hypothetical protein